MLPTPPTSPIRSLIRRLWASADAWHMVAITGATIVAGGLDYIYNVAAGRLLQPSDYSALLAVTAILQILLHLTNVIRNIVAYYTAEIAGKAGSALAIGSFLRRSFKWGWGWGIVAASLMAALSPLLKPPLQLPDSRILLAGSLAVLMLFVRPITDGALQGIQRFWGLSSVILLQAGLRLILALAFIQLGWGAFGAMMALPIATSAALLPGVALLWAYFKAPGNSSNVAISKRYSAQTLVGLGAFALLVNSDAILSRAIFSTEIAGNYAPLITLGKINLFVPLALAMALFPKVVERHQAGRPVRPILLATLGLATLPGLMLTVLFFVAPEIILGAVFGDQYQSLGLALGMTGLATTLYAGISIWLNFALAAERSYFIIGLAIITLGQITGITLFHQSILQMTFIMTVGGIAGNLWGAWAAFKR